MALPAFNRERLLSKLKSLEDKKKLSFGVVTCTRLLPNYAAFVKETNYGSVEVLQFALNYVCDVLTGNLVQSNTYVKELIISCEQAAPNSEDFETILVTLAQDACFSVCALLDFLLKPDIERIIQVAVFATDTVDLFVQEELNLSPSDPLLEDKILLHHLMQQELKEQVKNLHYLEELDVLNAKSLKVLKESWGHDGKSNIGLI